MLCYNCMHEKGDAAVCPRCHAEQPVPLPHHLLPGSVIGGRYTVGKALGEGGFGITYIGLDNKLEMPVALKEFFFHGYSQRNTNTAEVFPIMTGNNAQVYANGKQRFLNEAKNIARFSNERGIVNVTDFFEDNNTAYIVMEYLQGTNLRDYLRARGTMTPQAAVDLLTPMMQSLSKIHQAGLIHRDVSPDNIMVLHDGTVKLMDFGAARDYADDNRSLSVMLKPGYAPEEQYRRHGQQGPWTDVYGISATIYRCITGQPPLESIERTYADTLKKPSELGVAISPAMEEALMYGLAVRRENRCPDMDELMKRLREGLAGRPAQRPAAASPAPAPSTPVQTVPDDRFRTVPANASAAVHAPAAAPVQAPPMPPAAKPSFHVPDNAGKTVPASSVNAPAPAKQTPVYQKPAYPQPPVQNPADRPSPAQTPAAGKKSKEARTNLSIVAAVFTAALMFGGVRLLSSNGALFSLNKVTDEWKAFLPIIPIAIGLAAFFFIKIAPQLEPVVFIAAGVFLIVGVLFFAGALDTVIGSFRNDSIYLGILSVFATFALVEAALLYEWISKA